MLGQKVWVVESSSNLFRAFRIKDDAYKVEFDVLYDFYKNELESDILSYEKRKDPDYAESQWLEPVTDDEGINLCKRALDYISRVKDGNDSWEKKIEMLHSENIEWTDEMDSGKVSIGFVCCCNSVPELWVHELEIE